MLFSLVPLIGSGTNYNSCGCIGPSNQTHVVLSFYHVSNIDTNAVWLALFLKGGVETHIESPVPFLIWNCWNLNQWQQNGQPHHAMAPFPVLMWGANFLWLCFPMTARWGESQSQQPPFQKILDFLRKEWIAACFGGKQKQPWQENKERTTRKSCCSCSLL